MCSNIYPKDIPSAAAQLHKIYLASGSPRRRQLLAQAGLDFEVIPSNKEEYSEEVLPAQKTEALSLVKAEDILTQTAGVCIVIGADTVVACDDRILGKPLDTEDAIQMLLRLQGRCHQVYTGVTLLGRTEDGRIIKDIFHKKTDVKMYAASREEIEAYVASGESADKAGAYGIQGLGALLVEEITGDYNNVVGLPLAKVCRRLKRMAVQMTDMSVSAE